MIPEFNLDRADSSSSRDNTTPASPESEGWLRELLSRRLEPGERNRLERLLQRLKERKLELAKVLQDTGGAWAYEDHFYRYYHGSFKVYRTQETTEQVVSVLRALLPERKLNMTFERIVRDGTGKQFELEHNKEWDRHTLPILQAFAHARFMLEMAVRYTDLAQPPQPMPNGYAALLYLYDLR